MFIDSRFNSIFSSIWKERIFIWYLGQFYLPNQCFMTFDSASLTFNSSNLNSKYSAFVFLYFKNSFQYIHMSIIMLYNGISIWSTRIPIIRQWNLFRSKLTFENFRKIFVQCFERIHWYAKQHYTTVVLLHGMEQLLQY